MCHVDQSSAEPKSRALQAVGLPAVLRTAGWLGPPATWADALCSLIKIGELRVTRMSEPWLGSRTTSISTCGQGSWVGRCMLGHNFR